MLTQKIVVMGGKAVGKSSIILRYLKGTFDNDHKPTLQDLYSDVFRLPNGTFRYIEVIDTSGSCEFPAMRDLCIQSGHAFILVYSVVDCNSFQLVKSIYNHIVSIRGSDVHIVLVENKIDLINSRQVAPGNGMEFAKRTMSSPFLEASARYNLNIETVFSTILQTFCDELEQTVTV